MRESVVLLGIVRALVIAEGGYAVAQIVTPLTVRPHEIATGTRTARPGKQTLEGEPLAPPDLTEGARIHEKSFVYVPQPCVGTRRCPLVVVSNGPEKYYVHIAEKYEMIVAELTLDTAILDQELQTVLRTYAIDPDKIAIMGRCATGRATMAYGEANPNVFRLVVVGTQENGDPPVKVPRQMLAEYFIAGGLLKTWGDGSVFWSVRQMRDRGYTVTHSFQFRGHSHTEEEYDFMGHWLQERWAIPNPTARPVPYTFGDPPLLTVEVLAQMTTVWTRFMREPDSIKTTARQALVREVFVPVGKERISTLMVDMSALAAKYPSVAGAFNAAKLTPQQYDAYRAALASTAVYKHAFDLGTNTMISADSVRSFLGVESTSAVAKNLEFMSAHPDEFSALEATGMWETP